MFRNMTIVLFIIVHYLGLFFMAEMGPFWYYQHFSWPDLFWRNYRESVAKNQGTITRLARRAEKRAVCNSLKQLADRVPLSSDQMARMIHNLLTKFPKPVRLRYLVSLKAMLIRLPSSLHCSQKPFVISLCLPWVWNDIVSPHLVAL